MNASGAFEMNATNQTIRCVSCGKLTGCKIDQSAIDNTLRWYMAYTCGSCGSAVEFDDVGFPPAEIRKLILDSGGCWEIFLLPEENRVKAVKLLKNKLEWTNRDALARLKNPNGPVFQGTRTEVEWLHSLLIQDGVRSRQEETRHPLEDSD